jgi:hypothetical protein
VRSGGQSHFHAPAAIKSWAARGLIMRARIYVNGAIIHIYGEKNRNRPYTNNTFCTFLSVGLRWQRIISQSDVLTFISIFQNAPTDIHGPQRVRAKANWFGVTKFGTAASRKNVLSWRFDFFLRAKKSMMRGDFNRVFPLRVFELAFYYLCKRCKICPTAATQ